MICCALVDCCYFGEAGDLGMCSPEEAAGDLTPLRDPIELTDAADFGEATSLTEERAEPRSDPVGLATCWGLATSGGLISCFGLGTGFGLEVIGLEGCELLSCGLACCSVGSVSASDCTDLCERADCWRSSSASVAPLGEAPDGERVGARESAAAAGGVERSVASGESSAFELL